MFKAHLTNQISLAIVTETWPPEVNGVAHTIKHLVNGLRQRDHYKIQLIRPKQKTDTTPACEANFQELFTQGVTLPFYREVRIGLPHFFKLRRAWKANRPDVVQVVTEGPLGYSAMWAAKSLNIPVISDFHTNFDQYSQYYNLRFAFKLASVYLRHLHNATQKTLVPTTELSQQLEESGYKNLYILERGIEADLFHPNKRSDALRERLGVKSDQLLVTLVTRLAQEKNIDLAFKAFRAIKKEVPDAHFMLVGDGPERARLEAANPDCHFVGMQRGENLAAHYASCDLFLYPSTSETFGNVIIEAMASGLPVVTYDYAAAHKYIQTAENGLTVPLHDEAAFIDLSASAACDAHVLRETLGKRARLTAQTLSWHNVVDRLDTIIKQLITEVHNETSTSAKRSRNTRLPTV
ncbi:glycosyltransferase family 1 protein [Leucothrix sargassi]|nr:glycosyltransferase family 1 protein [Leucothrix sargassi]